MARTRMARWTGRTLGQKRTRRTELTHLSELWERAADIDPMIRKQATAKVASPSKAETEDTKPSVSVLKRGNSVSTTSPSTNSEKKNQQHEEDNSQSIGNPTFDVLLEHGSGFLDFQTLMACKLASKTTYENIGRISLERCVCRYFSLTTDIKAAADRVVKGGWLVFVHFLANLAHTIQTSFEELGVSNPPKLYLIAMAQQAIRRLDWSPHPLLFGNMWGTIDDSYRSQWRYEVEAQYDANEFDDNEEVLPRRPTLSWCFGASPDDSVRYVSEMGRLMLPRSEVEFPPDVQNILRRHILWVAANGKPGSLRQKIASNGDPPYLFIAQDGIDSYTVYWVLALDDEDRLCCKFLYPYGIRTEEPFRESDQGSNLSKWLVQSSAENTCEWSMEQTPVVDLLGWCVMAKALKIQPFDTEFDLKTTKDALKVDNLFRMQPAHLSHRDPYETAELIWKYHADLKLIVNDD